MLTFTMTCGRRPILLKRTLDSFVANCEDRHLIGRYIAVVDRGMPEELQWLREHQLGFEVFVAGPGGHPAALNQLFQLVTTDLVVHWEDDWLLTAKRPILQTALDIAASADHIASVTFHSRFGIHVKATSIEYTYRLYTPGADLAHFQFPPFSLNPSIYSLSKLRIAGQFNPDLDRWNFEYDFGRRLLAAGFHCAYMPYECCEHIGDEQSAYVL